MNVATNLMKTNFSFILSQQIIMAYTEESEQPWNRKTTCQAILFCNWWWLIIQNYNFAESNSRLSYFTVLYVPRHTGLTRVSSIRFLLFEIKRVLVFNSIIFYFTDLFIIYNFIQNAYANKQVLEKKANKLCLMGQNVIESHSFLEYWQNR